MAGLDSIGTVTVYVKDQDTARTFYTQALGLEIRSDLPMGPGNNWLTVAPAGSPTEIMLFRDDEKAGSFAGIVFQSRDIQGAYERLAANGVTFSEPPTQQEWGGIQAQFSDPDGNGFVLVQLPGDWHSGG
jgi:catechol 2,3-dioxygenase-like lactoylglutathione lyase family enzyme